MHSTGAPVSSHQKPLLQLPRRVLRVAFAGNRNISAPDDATVRARLRDVFNVVCQNVVDRAHDSDGEHTTYYSTETPLVRLITGLAEGADSEAWIALQEVCNGSESFQSRLSIELAAVLPCALPQYRAGRNPAHLTTFDRHVAQCAYVVELDGIMHKPSPDTDDAKRRRGRGYRAQSSILIRHADLLVAVADPDEGKSGGTMETIRKALAFDIPVLFIALGTNGSKRRAGDVLVLSSDSDFDIELSKPTASEWQPTLTQIVSGIVADPVEHSTVGEKQSAQERQGEILLHEYFYDADTPWVYHDDDSEARGIAYRDVKPPHASPERVVHAAPTYNLYQRRYRAALERWWDRFAVKFNPGKSTWQKFRHWLPFYPAERPTKEAEPFGPWRTRARSLNYQYSGLYRGTFFVNFVRAVLAVACATTTLVLLGIFNIPAEDAHGGAEAVHGLTTGQILILLVIGSYKFYLVRRIYLSTHKANHEGYNDKAVAYRYLAERFRSMLSLPLIGSFRSPSAAAAQYASSLLKKNAVDWLSGAILRSTSPATLDWAHKRNASAKINTKHDVSVLTIDPVKALASLRSWVVSQIEYHKNARIQMSAMYEWAERWGGRLGQAVIWIVGFDILGLVVMKALPHDMQNIMHSAAPWLVLSTALLPAAVASLNGIRFQSECQRLADRSDFMLNLLGGRLKQIADLESTLDHARKHPADDDGAWTLDVLRQTELVARDFAQEAADWAVLYRKQVHEP